MKRTLCGAGLLASAALALSACGTSGSSNTTTTAPAATTSVAPTTVPTAATVDSSLSSLEKPPSGKVSLTEDGSSLLYPLYQAWVKGYSTTDANFASSSGADGSGTGISDAESGTTTLGASDAYLPPGTSTQYPTLENIPLAISAQMITYNLPGMAASHVKLDAQVIAGMYDGTITKWDAPAVKALNPGVKLPSLTVVPVHRSDSSGDSFLFTSFLAAADPSSFAAKQGPSTQPSFPSVSGAVGAEKNSGMIASCQQAKGCIAYVGISYRADAATAGLGEAALKNKAGAYELPTAASISAEAGGFTNVPPTGTLSLIYGSAASGYPIINFEYVVVKTSQSSAATASGIRAFLAWCMDPRKGGSPSYLKPVGFQPLPNGALQVAVALVKKIS